MQLLDVNVAGARESVAISCPTPTLRRLPSNRAANGLPPTEITLDFQACGGGFHFTSPTFPDFYPTDTGTVPRQVHFLNRRKQRRRRDYEKNRDWLHADSHSPRGNGIRRGACPCFCHGEVGSGPWKLCFLCFLLFSLRLSETFSFPHLPFLLSNANRGSSKSRSPRIPTCG